MYKKLVKDDNGFTGLEAAIVLIAFVVVAAVFSYVMLGAGFFTTQKSQEVVHTGVTQASSSIAPSGDVIVRGADVTGASGATLNTGGYADQITFYISNTAGGTPVDLDKTLITYTDDLYSKTRAYTETGPTLGTKGSHDPAVIELAGTWATATTGWVYYGVVATDLLGATGGDNLLQPGEKYKVVIDLHSFLGATATLPSVNEKFKIEVKPPEGAVLTITKTLPPALANPAAGPNYYPVY